MAVHFVRWIVGAVLVWHWWCGSASAQQFRTLPSSAPCFTGVAHLALKSDTCRQRLQALTPLSAPFDPLVNIPWDCMNKLVVSVDNCALQMASMVQLSQSMFNFSCSWTYMQGNIVNGTHARVSSWVRPSAVAGYMLRTTNLAKAANSLNSPQKPTGWQLTLEQMIGERSLLIADPNKPGLLVLSQFNRTCNTTFEVTSGGIMGLGEVNRSSMGAVVRPNQQPFKLPYIIQGTRSGAWRGRMRALFIALIVVVCLFGTLLLGCLGLLIYRLCQAGKRKGPIRGSPFDDGIAHMEAPVQSIGAGVSSLEHHSKRVGPAGGL